MRMPIGPLDPTPAQSVDAALQALQAYSSAATNSTAITASPQPIQFCGCPTSAGVSTVSCGAVCPSGAQAGTYAMVSAQGTYYTLINYQIVATSYTYNAQSTARLQ